jgi:hypothetical protein
LKDSTRLFSFACLAALASTFCSQSALAFPVVKEFPVPIVSGWGPEGCVDVRGDGGATPTRATWTNLHGNTTSSDEILSAIAPAVVEDWTAEGATYNPTGPVFDDFGNLYFSPLLPFEDAVLISISADTGGRRFKITNTTGAASGASSPMVLDNPAVPGTQTVVLALYDRVIMIDTDGATIWDVPTGLTQTGDAFNDLVFGVNYVPTSDAVVMATRDGFVVALDRATGAQLLAAPYQLPGLKSPDEPGTIPPLTVAAAEVFWLTLVDGPVGGFQALLNMLLGEDTEVGNHISVDPVSGRIWIAATAPDGDDGLVDGLSEDGALYGFDLVGTGPSVLTEACRANFTGGSASTPTISADRSHIYVGDSDSNVLALSTTDCTQSWAVPVDGQVVGSIGASGDGKELYVSTLLSVHKIIDEGTSGSLVWSTSMSGLFNELGSNSEFNLNLVSVAPNGLYFQAGSGQIINGTPLPVAVGVGVLDRESGALRHFTGGGEETVAVMSAAADGNLYLGNSPVRRAFALALGHTVVPLRGGITKFKLVSEDLLAREAGCAIEARVQNLRTNAGGCSSDSVDEDLALIGILADQFDTAFAAAVASGTLKGGAAKKAGAAKLALDDALVAAALDPLGGALDEADLAAGALCSLVRPGGKAKLGITDGPGTDGDRLSFSVNDKTAGITKGNSIVKSTIDATLTIEFNGATASYEIPAGESDGTSGWKKASLSGAVFSNSDADTGVPTGISGYVIKNDKGLKAKAVTLGDSSLVDLFATGAPTGRVEVRAVVTAGGVTNVHCTRFFAAGAQLKEAAGGTKRKLKIKGGVSVSCE